MGKRAKTGGLSKAGKRNRILAAALGFVATAGAFAAFAQSEAPREWKSRRGKTVVTGTLDVKQTNQEFAADAETPEKVFFRGGDGKLYSFAYENLADADKKRVDVALGLTAEVVDSNPANSANSINNANSANDAIPASGGDSESRALKAVPKDCVRRAVLVGVDDYAEFGDLRFAGADVELIRSRLLELGFAPENIVALTTESGRSNSKFAPTKRNIERELSRILAASSPDDMIFVMFTGHGFQTDNFGGYGAYVGFAPSDAVPNDETVVDFASTVSLSKLFDEMKDCRARFKWALVDACRENLGLDASGGGLVASKSLARSKALRKLEAPAGVAILQSCAEGEFSWEKDGHGVFARTFAESLTEVGDANEDGAVTLFEAATRTMDEVKRETSDRSTFDATQTPYLSGYATNFVVADVKTAEAKERWRAAVEAREKGDYATALTEIDAALALMPEKTEYATEKRAIEAFATAAKKAKAEAQAAAEKARREAESAAQAERERLEAELAAAKAEAEKAKEEAAARANAERQAQNAGRTSAPGTGTTSAEASASGGWFDKHEPGTLKTLTVDGIEYRFRYCPAGTFTMGSPE
ncbi:MAG: caspase family protein, partial [Thermoguttaceae bacterium]|nr:caspase family protein [Thermoguttaceae bacterium]